MLEQFGSSMTETSLVMRDRIVESSSRRNRRLIVARIRASRSRVCLCLPLDGASGSERIRPTAALRTVLGNGDLVRIARTRRPARSGATFSNLP